MKVNLVFILAGGLTAVWAILAIYVFSEVKKTYAKNGTFTGKLLNWWFAMWGVYLVALILSAWYGIWPMGIERTFALITGLILFFAGLVLLAIGMLEFRTLRRSCGQDTSELITGGIYGWSRNPQFIGCLLYLLGISVAGRSIYAFALTGAASIIIWWYTIYLAEPYLERLYGEDYRAYLKGSPRWLGIPGRGK